MKVQFEYITDLAKTYKSYNDDNSRLYAAINEINEDELNQIYDEYGAKDIDFRPVNLLRAESVKFLLEGIKLTPKLVEEIKNNIRQKKTEAFKHYPSKFIEQIKDYRIGKRDIFANWQNPWSIFHTYFYRGVVKQTTQQYLEQICLQLKQDLNINDYALHWVDFNGSANFGSDYAWLVLYPEIKHSHQAAYQFFIKLSDEPVAGRVAGHSISNAMSNIKKPVNSYADALEVLNEQKSEIINLNKETRNYFKYAPGNQAMNWEEYYHDNVAKISYSKLEIEDISNIESRKELNLAAGLTEDSNSNQVWNLWLFKSANIGDVIFASKGTRTCLGIGIIEGHYQYDKTANDFKHYRKVNWIVKKVYQYKEKSYKNYTNLFRVDTFSPTNVYQFILDEYVRLYPELKDVFEKYNLKINEVTIEDPTEPQDLLDEERAPKYWWLNAKPSVWSISATKLGETRTYTSYNEKGNKRRIYKYFEEVQKGDLIIGYESSPVKQVKGIFEITKALHISEKEGEIIEFELVEKLEVPVNWNELSNNQGLANCEVFINNQGSLFKLSEDEFDIIRNIIDNKNILSEQLLNTSNLKAYSYLNDPDKPFIEEKEFRQIVNILQRNKNIILQGPPGTGKTFIARKLAYDILGFENDAQIAMVQFHQSYSYEDFIQGLRPSRSGFELKNGSFYTFCQKAHAHPDRQFFFIIDKINRGNLSKIFGELLMLIEADKRKSKFALKLTYAEEDTDTFYIPENLYIIGTMNTADRSLAIVDYALRRRFAFINLKPNYGSKFINFLEDGGISSELAKHISTSVQRVNKVIADDINLGSGFEIGHSYFCSFNGDMEEMDWYNEVLDFEIKPLLEEIWFDNLEEANSMVDNLRKY